MMRYMALRRVMTAAKAAPAAARPSSAFPFRYLSSNTNGARFPSVDTSTLEKKSEEKGRPSDQAEEKSHIDQLEYELRVVADNLKENKDAFNKYTRRSCIGTFFLSAAALLYIFK